MLSEKVAHQRRLQGGGTVEDKPPHPIVKTRLNPDTI